LNTPEIPGMNSEQPQTDGKAIGSLICGIASVTILSILAGIPAVILGHISRSDIRNSGGRLKGQGLALAGLIMGYISLAVIPLILIAATILIPSLIRSRQAAHEAAAVSTLWKINTAEEAYRSTSKGRFGQMTDLVDKNLLDPDIRTAVSGYSYAVTVSAAGSEFTATAEPAATGQGRYGYFITTNGEVRYSTEPDLAPAGSAGKPVH
jgi:type II secretory pathway pseudopilin PulG